jgi:hypothetical protein
VAQQTLLESNHGKLLAVKEVSSAIEGHGQPMKWIAIVEARYEYERGSESFALEFHKISDHWQLYGYKQLD